MSSYEAPLRCQQCGMVIRKKPKAKTPKYCPQCRETKQQAWKKANLSPAAQRKSRFQAIPNK